MNKKLLTLIVDDDAASRIILKNFCEKIPEIELIGDFENPLKAADFVNANEVDLIFLDIHMPEINGIEFIQINKSFPFIIITSSDKNFALEAFDLEVNDYLLKPLTFPRFVKAINKLKKNFDFNPEKKANKEIYINVNRKLKRISLDNISIIEAKGDYVLIRTNEDSHIVHSTMKKMEESLPDNYFVKVHRSYIINTKKIKDIVDNSLLIGSHIIPISRSKKEDLYKRLNKL